MTKILLKSAAIGLFASMIFTGCTQNQQGLDTASSDKPYVDPELQGAKPWVMMPFVEGAIAEVGSAPRNAGGDFSFQRNEAMADARDNLARQISVKVSNMFKSFKSATGAGTDGSFDRAAESVSKQVASQTLAGSKMKDYWISRSGTMYVLMVLDTDGVKSEMEKAIKTSFKDDKALYQKFLAAKAQGELDSELEKLANQQ